jgi:hypothetical protein
MRLCAALGLEQVVLVGHADGALVSLVAATLAGQQLGGAFSFSAQPHPAQQPLDPKWAGAYPEELTPKFLMGRLSSMLGRAASVESHALGVPLNDAGGSSMRHSYSHGYGSSASLQRLAVQQQQQQQQQQEEGGGGGAELEVSGSLSSASHAVHSNRSSAVSMRSAQGPASTAGVDAAAAAQGLIIIGSSDDHPDLQPPQGLQRAGQPGTPPPRGERMSRSASVHVGGEPLATRSCCTVLQARRRRALRWQDLQLQAPAGLRPAAAPPLPPTHTRTIKNRLTSPPARPPRRRWAARPPATCTCSAAAPRACSGLRATSTPPCWRWCCCTPT